MSKLQGKIALVTGGSSGIGLATAKAFVAEGATVYITGRRATELEAARKLVGKNVIAVQGDTSKLADLDTLVATIKEKSGRLDIIFANAGVGCFLKLGDITEEQVALTLDVNVKGTIFTIQKALPLLVDGAAIVMNSSVAASKGMPAFSVYASTKAAIRNLARGFATDLAARRIRVNVVSPGYVPTPAYTGSLGMAEADLRALDEQAKTMVPLGRVGKVEEIAKAVVFLVSDDASYVNGAELVVDGGLIGV